MASAQVLQKRGLFFNFPNKGYCSLLVRWPSSGEGCCQNVTAMSGESYSVKENVNKVNKKTKMGKITCSISGSLQYFTSFRRQSYHCKATCVL